MKNFLTSLLGTLAALMIFAFVGLLVVAGLIGAAASVGAGKAARTGKLEPGSYLVLDLSDNILDAPPAFELGSLGDDQARPQQLRPMLRAIRAAARDPDIAGILIKGQFEPAGYGSGYAALREVREELIAFRRSRKPVKAYLDTAALRDYYLASAASEVELNPYGELFLPGLAVRSPFLAGALERYGVGVQVVRVGKFKSAVEPLTRRDMSPENREEYEKLLGDLWGSLREDMAASRGLTPARLQELADARGLISAEEAKKAGLVDRLAYRDQVIDEIRAEAGAPAGDKKDIRQISLAAYERISGSRGLAGSGPAVGVVYAEGDIVDGEGGPGVVGGTAFARELRRMRQDDSIKAVVLRVNSPGGSAAASEEIQRELRLIRAAHKPLVVSMGTYAASGGYWISTYADRIFAQPTTVTGSIGVFGLLVNFQQLAADHGIAFDGVKTGRFADAETVTRPKTEAELAVLQERVQWLYSEFVAKVAESRRLSRGRVDEIGQGRVWSGAEARRLGLVDEFGGLSRAVAYAAGAAGLGQSFRVEEYPERKDLAQALADLLGRLQPDGASAPAAGLAARLVASFRSELGALSSLNDPQGAYARLPLEFSLP